MSCIYYTIQFIKNQVKIQALIDSRNEVNAMTPIYASKLDLKVCFTNVGAQKIDDSTFEIFEIVLASFEIKENLRKTRFF